MKHSITVAGAALAAFALAPAALADLPRPGSALVYPIHRSSFGMPGTTGMVRTLISVTNTNMNPVDGGTNVHFQYVNVLGYKSKTCMIVDRVEHLTPADTLTVLTNCHNPIGDGEGYLVVSAQDPDAFNRDWSFNHLVGSELGYDQNGATFAYSMNAITFESPQDEKDATDLDDDGQLDFDGVEYDAIADHLYLDNFYGIAETRLILINLTGGAQFDAVVAFDAFNDNEFPLSATTEFRCWTDRCLNSNNSASADDEDCVSLVFDNIYLLLNTPQDPDEVDFDCMPPATPYGDGLETGWARIRGLVANSSVQSIQNPALLGASIVTSLSLGGRELFGSTELQENGAFLNFGVEALD